MNALRWSALSLVMLLNCATASGAVGAAVINTAVAAGASGVSRANGGCYASCQPGTRCNSSTGMCDRIRCGGECKEGEECIESGGIERCMTVTPLRVETPKTQ